MSWFKRYIESQWNEPDDNPEDIERFLRENLIPQWMERMPNGKYYWQSSLDMVMNRGRQQFGAEWDGSPYDQTGLQSDRYDNKKAVFFNWLQRVPPKIVHYLKGMIDDYLEKTEGFRPFETASTTETETDIDVPSSQELEEWMG